MGLGVGAGQGRQKKRAACPSSGRPWGVLGLFRGRQCRDGKGGGVSAFPQPRAAFTARSPQALRAQSAALSATHKQVHERAPRRLLPEAPQRHAVPDAA